MLLKGGFYWKKQKKRCTLSGRTTEEKKMERLRSECMTCILKKYMEDFPENTDEKKKIEYLRTILSYVAEAPMTSSAPVIVRDITALQEKMLGIINPYGEVKKYFNKVMLGYETSVKEKIRKADDPLKLAVQYALIGNYIDFGAMRQVDEEELQKMLDHASDIPFDAEQLNNMRTELKNSKKLTYITDNCGEVVMDKVLIEILGELYPKLEITVLVRGAAVLNDATMEDAIQVGLPEIVTIIPNGNAIAGTCIEELSDRARQVVDEADILISKGQGNFETLRKCGLNVYYLFLCKCEMFARIFDVPKLTGIVVNDRCLKEA